MNANVNTVKPWYREPWPWILMAGPVAVIIAGFITAWLAIRSFDGMVDDDYYKQGLAVNQRLERDNKAAELGFRVEAMLGGDGQEIRLFLTAKDAKDMPKALLLKVTRPTRAGEDQAISLAKGGEGFYAGRFSAPLKGRWNVTIEDEARAWRIVGEWNLEKQQTLRLPVAGAVSSNHHGG